MTTCACGHPIEDHPSSYCEAPDCECIHYEESDDGEDDE